MAVAGTALPQLKSDTTDEMPAEADEELDKREIPMRYRLAAFSMILFFATGSSYCESTISPIKSILRKQLKITSRSCHFTADDRCAVRCYHFGVEPGQHHSAYHWWYRNRLLGGYLVSDLLSAAS